MIDVINTEKRNELKYPIFMQSTNSNLTVCFSSMNEGHVVIRDGIYKLGEYSNTWVNADDPDQWKPYIEPEEPKKIKLALYTCYDSQINKWIHPRPFESLEDFMKEFRLYSSVNHHMIPNSEYELEL